MINRYPVKKYPLVGVCGLDCGLCPRYHTDGKSKCPGCCGPGFWEVHPSCSFITCAVKQKGLETCGQCKEWQDCLKLAQLTGAAVSHDSFISYRSVPSNLTFIRRNGIEEFARQEKEKQHLLMQFLEKYDDGRSKLFFCTACQVLPLEVIAQALTTISNKLPPDADIKKKAKVSRASLSKAADTLKIEIKLRK